MSKCWMWLRRSTDNQELSIEDQRKACFEFAAANGWTVDREFLPEKGYGSGLTIDRDAAFLEMVRLAEAGGHDVRYLVVYDVSRFGRLAPESKIYWEQRIKRQGGIQIVYVKDDFKNDGSIGDVLSKVVKHSEAHQYSMKLSELTLRGSKSHAALGHSTGGKPPYGYARQLLDETGRPLRVLAKGEPKPDTQHVTWTVNTDDAAIIRTIFEMYDKGQGLNMIVSDLNQRSVPAPRGLHWSKPIVSYMLRNRAYVGERIYNKRCYKGYRRGERGSLFNAREQWVVKENAHTPIVERELFDRVQAKVQARTPGTGQTRGIGKGRPYHSPYLLTGLAACSCGYRLIGWPKSGNGHRYHTYTCGGYQRIGPSVCRSYNVRTDELENYTVQAIREQLASEDWKAEVRESIASLVQERFGTAAEKDALEIRSQLVAVDRQIQNLVQAIQAGRYSQALHDGLTKLEAQRSTLTRDLTELQEMAAANQDVEEIFQDVLKLAGDFESLWKSCATNEEKKRFLRTFIHQVRVNRSDTTFTTNVWLYKIPMAPTNELARNTFHGIPGLVTNSLSSLRG